jgi:hypothetical protein
MRKRILAGIGLFVGLTLSGAVPAVAAELNPSQVGTSCETAALWHFVNNQTGGAQAGFIQVIFDSGEVVTVAATQVNNSSMQFFVSSSGGAAIESAKTYTDSTLTTQLPGRLVLSDLFCDDTKKDDGKK